ncbi:hypothetical protein KSF_054500 [Reticulibacter mediterranei]|uniref:histidine kinase n=1 Tax=Reticulibacter mediterranei TaxID=2778369 RepID=A0A8J3N5Q9_9CHLR|nr:ATP-binding protein [Reticulibacter mediterranei]GHO95402.1 hypothetical protein KSF_054500 [Reticulibacter mediterranei]
MHVGIALPPVPAHMVGLWQRYTLDSLFALVGTLSITGFIYTFQLYPRIPNISIIYLLIVLALASTRSLYAALVASIVAFLSFDYFLIPPLYVFTIDRPEEWIALCIFLVTALLTGQLAFHLRLQAQNANRREQETHILYDLVRTTVEDESPERLLQSIVQAVVNVFGSWGVRSSALLLPDAHGQLVIQASAPKFTSQILLSPDEQALAQRVAQTGQSSVFPTFSPVSTPHPLVARLRSFSQSRHPTSDETGQIRFLPLKTGGRILGVLRLCGAGDLLAAIERTCPETPAGSTDVHQAFFWTFLDQAISVIERTRLRRETLQMEVLRRTDRLRAALLSSVSHDLRTPLATIKTVAGNLLQHDIQWDDKARETFARTIEREADRLNRFVGNLLDLSRIEGGALKLQKERYPLDTLIYEVLENLEPLLSGRTVQVDIPADVPVVALDYLHITQVLTNLFENAVRYSPPESPLHLQVQTTTQEVLIRLADQGPGVPEEEQERIFDKFYRVLEPGKQIPGSGIGLAVCRGLIEAHRGRIWEENREGGGAIFTFTLPLTRTEEVSHG